MGFKREVAARITCTHNTCVTNLSAHMASSQQLAVVSPCPQAELQAPSHRAGFSLTVMTSRGPPAPAGLRKSTHLNSQENLPAVNPGTGARHPETCR